MNGKLAKNIRRSIRAKIRKDYEQYHNELKALSFADKIYFCWTLFKWWGKK